MAPVLALVNPPLRRRIVAGVRSGAANDLVSGVRFAISWDNLRVLARQFAGSPAFVDPFGPTDDRPLDELTALQRACPSCPLVFYAELNQRRRAALNDAGATFAARLLPGIGDRLTAVGEIVLRTVCYHNFRTLVGCLKDALPAEARSLVDCLFAATICPCPVESLARQLGMSAPTLRRRCTVNGLPPPRKLIALARIYHVERLARWSGRPSGAVALALGYSDYANYARSVRNELGCRQSDVSHRGGPDYVGARFLGVVAAPIDASVQRGDSS